MRAAQSVIQIMELGKRRMDAVSERARELGMTPQRYIRHLLEEDLAISEQARSRTFEQLLGRGEAADETEIDRLVDAAKARHRRRRAQKG